MKYPDLPDIMAAGLGLTEALAWWSHMMNTPGRSPDFWWQELRILSAKATAESLQESSGCRQDLLRSSRRLQ